MIWADGPLCNGAVLARLIVVLVLLCVWCRTTVFCGAWWVGEEIRERGWSGFVVSV